ncbi:hypothetical protein GBA52_001120 [Prunus armeniaca]|nr:hypothetical protein GBA52_001120 [Prunus armeniaca]
MAGMPMRLFEPSAYNTFQRIRRSSSSAMTPPRAIRTHCVQYLPTKSNFIILSHGATAAGWITNLVGCRNIIKLDSENEKPDGSCADRVVPHGGVILFDETANLKPDFLQTCYNLLSQNDKQQPPVLISPHIQMDMTAAQHGPESDPAAAQPFPVEDNNGCCSACLKPLVACLKACYYLVSIAVAFMNCVEEA